MATKDFDPRAVDVVAMARDTGINIYRIYDALGIEILDPISSLMLNRFHSAIGTMDEGGFLSDLRDYEIAMGDFDLAITMLERHIAGYDLEGYESEDDKSHVLDEGTGVPRPWGTPRQTGKIRREMLALENPFDILEYYKSIPENVPEKKLAIRIIARFFVSPKS
jgi:hypothetical protein